MVQWLYFYLTVFRFGYAYTAPNYKVGKEPDGRRYLDNLDTHVAHTLYDKLYAGGKTPTRLPLSPQRNWERIFGNLLVQG